VNRFPTIDSRTVLAARGPKALIHSASTPAVVTELEPAADGPPGPSTTVFLLGKECPFRCLMCDLWRNTTDHRTEPGSLVRQLAAVLPTITHRDTIKLYNASNFFDPQAVPTTDLADLAAMVRDFKCVVVENHPKLLGPTVPAFAEQLSGQLQVAMGLETSDPDRLKGLNKQMTVADYDRACATLRGWGLSIRTFLLLPAPGVPRADMVRHTLESVRHALAMGSDVTSLIPLRAGNGALDQLILDGSVALADGPQLVQTFEQALALPRSPHQRILLDLWDASLHFQALPDGEAVIQQLTQCNLTQSSAAN